MITDAVTATTVDAVVSRFRCVTSAFIFIFNFSFTIIIARRCRRCGGCSGTARPRRDGIVTATSASSSFFGALLLPLLPLPGGDDLARRGGRHPSHVHDGTSEKQRHGRERDHEASRAGGGGAGGGSATTVSASMTRLRRRRHDLVRAPRVRDVGV